MKCCICYEEIEVYFKCEMTGRVACERCEKEVIQTNFGPKTAHACYVKEDHEHVRVPRLNEVKENERT